MNDVALAWTVSAENALINHNGFSPAQLAFGKASYLPSTINDDLPALESTIWSVDHISVIQAATKAFITSEALEKIKLALKKKYQELSKALWAERLCLLQTRLIFTMEMRS